MKSKGVLYYSDMEKDQNLMNKFRRQLELAIGDLPLVSSTRKPLDFGENIIVDEPRSVLTMNKQILAGLYELNTDYVFFTEDDVLYHPTHFEFTPPSDTIYYYNMNHWQVHTETGYAVKYDCKRLSQICANRKFLITHYEKRLERVEKEGFSMRMGYEPGTHSRPERVDDFKAEGWLSQWPNIDTDGTKTLTPRRWRPEDFRSQKNCQNWIISENGDIPGWGLFKEFFEKL